MKIAYYHINGICSSNAQIVRSGEGGGGSDEDSLLSYKWYMFFECSDCKKWGGGGGGAVMKIAYYHINGICSSNAQTVRT